jgi:hypothetical protein
LGLVIGLNKKINFILSNRALTQHQNIFLTSPEPYIKQTEIKHQFQSQGDLM